MLILTADRIIVGDGKTTIENGYIKINDKGQIAETGEVKNLKKNSSDTLVSYEGCSIMPGLFDLHVHFGNFWHFKDKDIYNDFLISLYSATNMKIALSKGVTTIRDVMGPDGLMTSLKNAVKLGYIQAPRIFHTNQAIICTGGHCWYYPDKVIMEADGVDAVRRAVRLQAREGADFIKAMGNHGNKVDFDRNEMAAIVDEAHRLGKKCSVHATIEESIDIAIDAGADTIEHGTFMNEKQAEKIAKSGQVWIPTLSAYSFWANEALNPSTAKRRDSPHFYEYAVRLGQFYINSAKANEATLKKYYDMGIKVATGSDNGVAEIADELELMCKYGLTPQQAIECATSNSADVCDIGDTVGKITMDYCADLLVTKGNPLDDIRTIRNVMDVYQNGKSLFAIKYIDLDGH